MSKYLSALFRKFYRYLFPLVTEGFAYSASDITLNSVVNRCTETESVIPPVKNVIPPVQSVSPQVDVTDIVFNEARNSFSHLASNIISPSLINYGMLAAHIAEIIFIYKNFNLSNENRAKISEIEGRLHSINENLREIESGNNGLTTQIVEIKVKGEGENELLNEKVMNLNKDLERVYDELKTFVREKISALEKRFEKQEKRHREDIKALTHRISELEVKNSKLGAKVNYNKDLSEKSTEHLKQEIESSKKSTSKENKKLDRRVDNLESNLSELKVEFSEFKGKVEYHIELSSGSNVFGRYYSDGDRELPIYPGTRLFNATHHSTPASEELPFTRGSR